MANRPLGSLLGYLRRRMTTGPAGEQSDADLLDRFARQRDEAAFADLMRRHGPMVLGVCRRVLHDEHDADDAFQAAFLVLARKAGAVGRPERLAGWLYGVALRVARKARAVAARRRGREQPVADMPDARPEPAADADELRQALDGELERLPEKFRLPILLCCVQGRSREEAARQLGWSPGAVKGMLERGRELLRGRLVRRGLGVSATALSALLSGSGLSAAVPAALGESTLKAALLFAAGQTTAAAGQAALAEGVLHAMTMSKLKVTLAVVLALGALGTAAGILAFGGGATVPPPPKKAKAAPREDAQAARLRKLTAARLDAAREAFDLAWKRFQHGYESEETVNLWSRRWLQAQLALSDRKADRDKALHAHRERLRMVDDAARVRWDLGWSARTLGVLDEEVAKCAAVQKQFENRKVTPEQACAASLRLLAAQRKYRKEFVNLKDTTDTFLKRFDERFKDQHGFTMRDPKSEFQAHLNRLKKIEESTRVRHEAGMYSDLDRHTVAFYRLEAEAWLADPRRAPDR